MHRVKDKSVSHNTIRESVRGISEYYVKKINNCVSMNLLCEYFAAFYFMLILH